MQSFHDIKNKTRSWFKTMMYFLCMTTSEWSFAHFETLFLSSKVLKTGIVSHLTLVLCVEPRHCTPLTDFLIHNQLILVCVCAFLVCVALHLQHQSIEGVIPSEEEIAGGDGSSSFYHSSGSGIVQIILEWYMIGVGLNGVKLFISPQLLPYTDVHRSS